MKKILFFTLTLMGCSDPSISPESRELARVAREDAFINCMELAAKMPRQSDDDVSKIVDSCDEQSRVLTFYVGG